MGDPAKQLMVFGILFFFWYSLTLNLKDRMGLGGHAGLAMGFLLFHYFMVPGTVSFSYVQAMLILTGAVNHITTPEKDKYYNVAALLFYLPVGLMGWMEGLACESIMIHIGGHLWYDMSIPISITIYFFYTRSCELAERAKAKVE